MRFRTFGTLGTVAALVFIVGCAGFGSGIQLDADDNGTTVLEAATRRRADALVQLLEASR